MSNSAYVEYTKISPHSAERTAPISKITIHHAATVNASLPGLGNAFSGSRTASANYGIDSNGKIGLYVDESRRSAASSNKENDNVAVTIEVANSTGDPDWKVSDAALESLVKLCVDICQRNGIEQLTFTGDKTGNLTMHKMFIATGCPGPYLESKFPWIAEVVNKCLAEARGKEIYRIQLGAYSKNESAETVLNELREAVRIAQNAVNTLEEALEKAFVARGVTTK